MRNKHFSGPAVALVLAIGSTAAYADLTDPRILSQLSPFEQRAAAANQAVYDQLTLDPDGPNGPLLAPCDPQQESGTGSTTCTGTRFQTFENVRELVHTANQLLGAGSGSTEFSLDLDVQNLGFALRWTAAEELAAQGSSATQFSNSQLNSLASRIAALRFGARGMRAAARSQQERDERVAGQPHALGGGAAADGTDESIASRWGGFIDGSYGYGRKEDTTFSNLFEDAFDYDGTELTLGADYRVQNSLVVGVIGGYTQKEVDFDSRVSIVDGTIDSDGYSAMVYLLWESDLFNVSGSVGGQWLSHDLVRRINYPSFNLQVAPVDETAHSQTDSSSILATFNAGIDLRAGAFTFEPYVKAEYQNITIDAFTEHDANGFDFNFGEQEIKSLDTALGFRLQYAFTPSWGVVVPYLRGELHKQLENDARIINAVYEGLDGLEFGAAGNPNFALTTDPPDDQFVLASAGFSVVLKRGLQGFLQYQQIFELDTYEDHAITGGFRFEF